MSKELKDLENEIFGGNPQWKAVPVICDDGSEFHGEIEAYHVFFMDVEYDPIRAVIDLDGIVQLPANDCDYTMMTADMLSDLARICRNVRKKHKR